YILVFHKSQHSLMHRYTGEEPSLDSLIAVLNLSSYYNVPEARQYAIRALDQHPDFRAPQRLRLA
ncbi:hypothetical protein NEOLEDRAFT_1074403, partial [Neolentinus lepideus HHB14362 ss-1]